MKEQQIIIEIDSDGRITADASGFTGDACIKDLERLLEELSPGTISVQRKSDAGAVKVATSRAVSVEKKS